MLIVDLMLVRNKSFASLIGEKNKKNKASHDALSTGGIRESLTFKVYPNVLKINFTNKIIFGSNTCI